MKKLFKYHNSFCIIGGSMKKTLPIILLLSIVFSCSKSQQDYRTELENKGLKWNLVGFLERISANDIDGVKLYLDAGWQVSQKYHFVFETFAKTRNADPNIFYMIVDNLNNKYEFLEKATFMCIQNEYYKAFPLVLKAINNELPPEGREKILNSGLSDAKTRFKWISQGDDYGMRYQLEIIDKLELELK